MAKRPRFSRWRRLPGVFRTGDHRPPETTNDLDRIILYVPARILDLAEALAEKAGLPSVQDYCALLLMQALENERIHRRVADFEARRGPLEGLKEIADDPDYLAEWKRQSETRPEQRVIYETEEQRPAPRGVAATAPATIEIAFPDDDRALSESDETERALARLGGSERDLEPDRSPALMPEPAGAVPIVTLNPVVPTMSDPTTLEILARHVGMAGDDTLAFLPSLRRGEPVSSTKAAELLGALGRLELDYRGATVLDRPTAHALHRLALESQVLLTDAWPGIFDETVIATIRAVQEAVERILSGQDIRYYPNPMGPGQERPL